MTYNLKGFGEKLSSIRKKLNYTQNYISRELGIHPDTLRKIEGGKVIPKIETLDNLSSVLKADITALFLEYRIDDYSYFNDVKGSLEAKLDRFDYQSLSSEIKMLNKLSAVIKNPYYKKLIKQLTLFATAIPFLKSKI
ncbi:helix-turn-helix transcriptional regulator [Proteinivorax hydrogeniformans]|uniref:Helix-turn-helix transcriptional regulator n=1 Tax=Proteinivorax hydrogeniformans TaxID=1826727 RepID=A0AAU8HT98_9FIRM